MIHLGFRLALGGPSDSSTRRGLRAASSNGAAAKTTLEIAVTLAGKVTAVLGPSGAGKTSLLEVIAGLRAGASGRVVVDRTTFLDSGDKVCLAPERRNVGYVPQEPALFPHLAVEDNVRYGLRDAIGANRLFDETIELLEIGPLMKRYPRTLSGGEAQRVALARALVTKPRLLLLDEPLAALDSELKGRILPYLMRVRDESKIPMLYVTHHAGEAFALADEALILRSGRVEVKGPARELLTPRLVASFDGEATFENIVDGIVIETLPDSGTAMLAPAGAGPTDSPTGELTLSVPGTPDLKIGHRVTYRVASEDILLLRGKPEGISARNILRGRVMEVENLGSEAIVRVATSGLEWRARVTPAAVRELVIDAGQELWVAIKTHTFQRLG
jgi:molybdate transport system ATP-binding protein